MGPLCYFQGSPSKFHSLQCVCVRAERGSRTAEEEVEEEDERGLQLEIMQRDP